MKALLYPTWFIFASIFSYLAYKHWQFSDTPIRPFFHREKDESQDQTGEIAKENELAREVVQDINNYIEKMNGVMMKRNRAAAIGYFVAAAVSLVSMILIYTG